MKEKLVGWGIALALALGISVVIVRLHASIAAKFKAQQRTAAEARCDGEAKCLGELSASFEQCYEENHTDRRRPGSRFNRDHELDVLAFEMCAHPGDGRAIGKAMVAMQKAMYEKENGPGSAPARERDKPAAAAPPAGEPALSEQALVVAGVHADAEQGKVDAVREALDRSPDLLRSTFGRFDVSLVHQAIRAPEDDMLKLLLERKAPLDMKSKYDGATPLHWAAAEGRASKAKLLLAAGAPVNAARDDGATPLHAALLADHAEAIDELVARGADVNARMKDGRTPKRLGRQMNDSKVEDLLESHGAK